MQQVTRRSVLVGSSLAAASLIAPDVARAQTAKVDKILLVINGTLGDKSFFDSAAHGLALIQQKYGDGVVTRVLEVTDDPTRWEPALLDASEQDWDIIIAGTYSVAETLGDVAKQHPDKKYILFDAQVPYEKGGYENVYSITYKQNEGSFLGGVLVAGLLKAGALPGDPGTVLGFLGGLDIPVIDDFLVGYVAGAKSVSPGVKVAVSYVGSFSDAAKGKELGLAQYRAGVSLSFAAASQAGLGLLSAAKETGRYVLGVDSDQEALFAKGDPAIASRVVSSVLKNVDVSLLEAYNLHRRGQLPWGSARSVGLAEGAVGIVETGNMARLSPPEVITAVASARDAVIAGRIKVPSALGMATADIAKLRDSVRP